jgi:hypothetical protein
MKDEDDEVKDEVLITDDNYKHFNPVDGMDFEFTDDEDVKCSYPDINCQSHDEIQENHNKLVGEDDKVVMLENDHRDKNDGDLEASKDNSVQEFEYTDGEDRRDKRQDFKDKKSTTTSSVPTKRFSLNNYENLKSIPPKKNLKFTDKTRNRPIHVMFQSICSLCSRAFRYEKLA